ncbi:MAG: 3-hydroxyacyl-CoA dehydrogenase NAD-binding domain-containing protein [Chlorobi bacterium]|nr:3-hydroxyacyl-CoA dehydrogenase NAD-binding domain-containing protein [Chlorobiota bacterium]
MSTDKHIGIIGAGTMGRGIALTCLLHGYNVTLSDSNSAVLTAAKEYISQQCEALLQKQRITTEQAEFAQHNLHISTALDIHSKADIVLESIIEDRHAKVSVMRALEALIEKRTILATNTSSISINSLAAHLQDATRCVGIHFFNPAPIMRLVEVIPSLYTNHDTITRSITFARNLGKEAIVVKDVPGFLVNRVVRNFYNEALRVVNEGAASFDQVDRLLEAWGFRMGPFRLMDLIGIDTNLSVTKSIFEQYYFEPRFQPSPLQQSYVDAGLLGQKTGRGFYRYPPE